MKLLLKNERHLIERWKNALHNRVPGLEVVTFPFVGDPTEIDVALVWEPPQGLLASMDNLRLVISTGAGVTTFCATRAIRATCRWCGWSTRG